MALAACGGSGDDPVGVVIGANEESLRVFADTNGDGLGDQDLADVLARGDTVTAREVAEASLIESFPDGGSYSSVDGTLAFAGDGDDLLVTFGPKGDRTTVRVVDAASIIGNQVVINDSGFYFDLFVQGDRDIADLLDDTAGNGYSIRTGLFYADDLDDFGFQTRAVLGAETTDARLATLGTDSATATYGGVASIEVRRADAGFRTFNANVFGDLDMNADFGEGTISGRLDNINLSVRTDFNEETEMWGSETSDPVAGALILNETTFSINGFSGSVSPNMTLTGDDPGLAAISTGVDYSGAFFGPQAEEVGGTISGGGSFEGTDYLAIGSFRAEEVE